MRTVAAFLLSLLAVVWLVLWGHRALALRAADQVCLLTAGPFLRCGPGPFAWQLPLIVALLPVALLGLAWALRCIVRAGVLAAKGWGRASAPPR